MRLLVFFMISVLSVVSLACGGVSCTTQDDEVKERTEAERQVAGMFPEAEALEAPSGGGALDDERLDP